MLEKLIYAFQKYAHSDSDFEVYTRFRNFVREKSLKPSNARSSSARESSHERDFRISDMFAGFAVLAVSYSFLWFSFQSFLFETVSWLLSAAQISVTRILGSDTPLLVVKLMDGSNLDLALTWQRCGLVSITVFGLLFLLLMYPLKGSIWLKLAWLELGFVMGLTWSLIRLLMAALISYYFGAGAFTVVEFMTGPLTDIFWVVVVWSLMLSTLIPKRRG